MDSNNGFSSRIAGFYARSVAERIEAIEAGGHISKECISHLRNGGGLATSVADRMSENVVAVHGLPLALGLNFRVNGRDLLVPMSVEEPSVVAAASNAARIVRSSGGFSGEASASVMTAQVQYDAVIDPNGAIARVASIRAEVLSLGNSAVPGLIARGGGCVDLDVRVLDDAQNDGMVVVHIHCDVGDAMGANLMDTVAEAVAPLLKTAVGGRQGLRILTNLCTRRMVRVQAIAAYDEIGGEELADGIVRASRFAELDPYRAATHNKGIMNGIDAVAVALGQDWRSIEAGAHAYAAIQGNYRSLSTWKHVEGGILGVLEMPLAAATVGGSTRVHPGVIAAFELLRVKSARELAVVMAATGLASNLAALRALAGEGIQRGHMRLHARKSEPDCTGSL